MNLDNLIHDIPHTIARSAHQGTSFVPERRGEQERESYANQLTHDFETLSRLADTDEKRATLEAEFHRYRVGYRRRTIAMLGAKSACLSTMIAGPSGFNRRRARKRSDAADKRTEDLLAYRERALRAIAKVLSPERFPVMAGAADAVQLLEAKVLKLEANQARMKEVNATIRKHAKAGTEAQVAAIVALGYAERSARNVLVPDMLKRVGFPDFELKNNSAEIRRLRKRLEGLRVAKASPDTVLDGEHARLEDSPADNRVRLYFAGKPPRETIERLKRSGFRWSPKAGAWSGYRSALAAAREIAGVAA